MGIRRIPHQINRIIPIRRFFNLKAGITDGGNRAIIECGGFRATGESCNLRNAIKVGCRMRPNLGQVATS